MGCKLSQLAASEFSHDPFDRPPPASDPRSPLTAKQQYCIMASWKGIFRQIEKTGIILFIKLVYIYVIVIVVHRILLYNF